MSPKSAAQKSNKPQLGIYFCLKHVKFLMCLIILCLHGETFILQQDFYHLPNLTICLKQNKFFTCTLKCLLPIVKFLSYLLETNLKETKYFYRLPNFTICLKNVKFFTYTLKCLLSIVNFLSYLLETNLKQRQYFYHPPNFTMCF